MNRRTIPAFEMSRVGQESLRREGFVVTSLTDSILKDPRRLRLEIREKYQSRVRAVRRICGTRGIFYY